MSKQEAKKIIIGRLCGLPITKLSGTIYTYITSILQYKSIKIKPNKDGKSLVYSINIYDLQELDPPEKRIIILSEEESNIDNTVSIYYQGNLTNYFFNAILNLVKLLSFYFPCKDAKSDSPISRPS